MSPESPDTSTPLAEIAQGPSAMDAFLDRNQKNIIVLAILIALGTAGFVVFQGIEKSRQETAAALLSKAEDIPSLQAILADNANTQAAASAMILLANQQWTEGKKEESIDTLQSFIADHPDHAAAASAKANLGSKWMTEGKSAEAVATFQDLVDDPQARHLAPYALLCIGDIAKAAGDKAKAEEAYKRVTSDFSDSNFAEMAKTRIELINAKAPIVVDAPPAAPTPAAPAPPTGNSGS